MSYSYEYDESGLASSYLALSILVPVALYYTYNILTSAPVKRIKCSCMGCENRVIDRQMRQKIITAVLWMIISYLGHNIRTLKIENRKGFDPLEVLGIENNTGMKDIKKRLRMLLMKYNVNKAKPELKTEYEEKQRLINKAYGLVSNKDKYESWLNNESKAGEIVAIPNIVVRNGILAFLIYSVLLGVFLPRWAYKKWRGIRDRNRVGVNFKTMEIFYDKIDKKMNQMKCSLDASINLISVMSKSVEFTAYEWKSNVEGLKVKIESNFAFPLKDFGEENKGYLVLMDHLFRMRQADASDAEYVQKVSLLLIEGMKAIAFAKKYGGLVRHLIALEAMVVQAVFDPKYSLLQIPFVSFENLFVQDRNKERISSPEIYLTSTLGGRKLESAMTVYSSIPKIEIAEFSASVIDTGKDEDDDDVHEVDENDVVTNLQAPDPNSKTKKSDQNLYIVPEKSIATITVALNKIHVDPDQTGKSPGVIHAPYMKESPPMKWIAMLTVDDSICTKVQLLNDFEKSTVVKFTVDVSGLKKVSECKAFVGCGEYLDANAEKSIIIKVE